MITQGSSLSDIGKRERTMAQILTEIVQAALQRLRKKKEKNIIRNIRWAAMLSTLYCSFSAPSATLHAAF